MLALIDSDILVYRVAWASQDVEEPIAAWRMNELIARIVDQTEADRVQHYLTSTDKSNFRYKLFPLYKANRTQPKPIHYDFLRQFLHQEHKALLVEGMEADDALGIIQSRGIEWRDPTVICSIDKDLDQIPGWHFNFVKERLYDISPIEAHRSFYEQVLVGDTGDNIQGCKGIGKVRANRMLEGCQNEEEMFDLVIRKYKEAFDEEWAEKLLLAGNLLWIRKLPDQPWCFKEDPVSKTVLETFSLDKELDSDTNQEPMNI